MLNDIKIFRREQVLALYIVAIKSLKRQRYDTE